jgi:hypothetical protein
MQTQRQKPQGTFPCGPFRFHSFFSFVTVQSKSMLLCMAHARSTPVIFLRPNLPDAPSTKTLSTLGLVKTTPKDPAHLGPPSFQIPEMLCCHGTLKKML